jgi:hypothetical protein
MRADQSSPLLELTIGGLLHRTAERFPDRLAVASCHQGQRLTWAELSAEADRSGAGAVVAGHSPRRPRGAVVHQLHRVDRDAHGLRAGRSGAGECEPRLPLARAAVHAPAVAHEGALSVAQGQARRLRGDPGPRAPRARPGTGAHHLLRFAGVAGAEGCRGRAARACGRGRRGQHPVHQRHHRAAQGRAADPSQHCEQRAVSGPGLSLHRAGQALSCRCRSSTATAASSAP